MEKKGTVRIFLWLAVIFLILWGLCQIPLVSSVIGRIISVVLPIPVGLSIAFILNIPLSFLEKIWARIFGERKKKLKRPICLILCLLFLIGLIVVLAVAVVPQLFRTVRTLIENIPQYTEQVKVWWGKLSEFLAQYSYTLPPLELDSAQIADKVGGYIEEYGHLLLDLSIDVALTVFSAVFDTVLSLVLALYVLAQKEKLGGQAKRFLQAFFSEKNNRRILNVARLTADTFAKFLTGQLTEAVILGVLCFIGMLIFRMPYALLISVLVGVTALIPVFGALIGIGIGAFLILMDSPIQALWFVIFILILQQVEGNLIYPKVVGKSVGLPGVWVLLAVTVGSSFGVVGMLLSVPICSVIYGLVRQFVYRKEETASERVDKGITEKE